MFCLWIIASLPKDELEALITEANRVTATLRLTNHVEDPPAQALRSLASSPNKSAGRLDRTQHATILHEQDRF